MQGQTIQGLNNRLATLRADINIWNPAGYEELITDFCADYYWRMELVLFDSKDRKSLYPFTHTRPIADLLCGILTPRQRWMQLLNYANSFTLTEQYLSECFPPPTGNGPLLVVNAQVIATKDLSETVLQLAPGEALYANDTLIAACTTGTLPAYEAWEAYSASLTRRDAALGDLSLIRRPWDLFSLNAKAIQDDFELITAGRVSASIPDDVVVRGTEIFLEEGAQIGPGTVINASGGPVYIGKDAEILEGCLVRGPFALCEQAVVKMGAKIYSGTSIGPGCRLGGEVSNVVMFANSNKGHDGFLGNAVIGEWCNLGADSNCSNLKNNYDEVKIWDEAENRSVKTGLTFCGLLMGDHSKCGINTMFNTGTVVGVSANIWGGGFPEKFVPSYSWGGSEGMSTYQFSRAMETASRMMARRNKILSDAERAMLLHVYEATAASRSLIFSN